ncbi:hypothetical protein GIB67_031463 [Kingdonia uniflora]|uniref:RNA helicase n=1 Tax=Kingdonia uniflora TaxID=39325 RepID=A0A7J7MB77_9MAGN|nr:hypothetical protein GIB67_031463 [Kingdonia uniflora]
MRRTTDTATLRQPFRGGFPTNRGRLPSNPRRLPPPDQPETPPVYYYKQLSNPKPQHHHQQQPQQRQQQHQRRFNFRIELRSRNSSFNKLLVENLVSVCVSPPDNNFVFNSGFIAARLFYKNRPAAMEALVFFWERRLAGEHLFDPLLISNVFVVSDKMEIKNRVRTLFVDYIGRLLDGEGVLCWKRRIELKNNEIKKIDGLLRRPQPVNVLTELRGKRFGLIAEKDLILKRLDEFRAGLDCIVVNLKGAGLANGDDNGENVEIFRLCNELNWSEVHCMIMRECKRLEEGLPIYACRGEILRKIHFEQVMILVGETGSGKSTQLVQFLADSGVATDKSIICTQPRKIAAISLAERVSEESNGCYEENSVICFPTFSSYQGFKSKVIFMTDNCLLQHYMNDNKLGKVSHIIIDEAHERSLNTDLLLALVKDLLLQRLDLRLIIMSATANAEKLSDYFFGCGILNVVGRNFPVDIRYVPSPSVGSSFSTLSPYVSDVVQVTSEIHKTEEPGAVLAFLTSQMEVEWACENFRALSAIALPLHGKLSWEEQGRIFKNYPGKRKVIFSTNLAETSLTIPGVKFVVDCGLVKESSFEPSSGMNLLKICRISQSSAKQRAGRAGRTEPGKCFRLYSDCDFHSMSSHQEPEIHRVHLGVAVLRILALGIKNIKDFDFVDAPSSEAIDRAIKNLIQLGAVTTSNGVFEFTEDGRYLVKMGIEPRLGKLILDSFHHRLGREGLVLAAVMANASSIFCRVGNEEDKLRSDRIKVQFSHRDGDLFTLLSVYKEWENVPRDTRNKWCWDNSINAKSMRRCEETVQEIEYCLRNELSVIFPSFWRWDPHMFTEHHTNLKKVILSSLAENVAMYSGYDRLGYQVALTGQHIKLHPSCSLLLYGQKPSWVVFGEILSVSSEYLVCVSAFDYECLSALSPPPLFDISQMENQKLQVAVITGFGSHVLRRFCGKSKNNLLQLLSSIQIACKDERISIEIDFDKRDILLFSSLEDMEKVRSAVNDALEYEKKSLRDECIEKCLYPGRPGHSPSVALFGAGGEIKHLELGKKFLSVEVFHSNPRALDDKKLLAIFEKCTSGICNYHKYVSVVGHEEVLGKWGKITFLTPEAAEMAVAELNDIEFSGSTLRISPTFTTFGGDHRFSSFPAVKARVFWPRRPSKGVAIVKCARQDAEFIVSDFSNLLIGERRVRCEISKNYEGSIVVAGLDKNISEPEILNHLRTATNKKLFEVFLLRGDPIKDRTVVSCEEALLKEFSPFMPTKNVLANYCRVQVFPPEQNDYMIKAMISFDGSLHLEAAKALDHIEGKVLHDCLSWQKIQVQHMFYSSVSCPAPVYSVIKKELDTLFRSFMNQKGLNFLLNLAKIEAEERRYVDLYNRENWLLQSAEERQGVYPSDGGRGNQLWGTRDGKLQAKIDERSKTRPAISKDFSGEMSISYNVERNENGSYRVKLSSNATRTVAQLRMPLEELMKGKTVIHANLTPGVLQLLFSRDGSSMLKSLQRETGTFVFYDRQNMNIRIFGPKEKLGEAESSLVQTLLTLHENMQHKINLRGRDLPHNLMKSMVENFGPELNGLKKRVPEAEFSLITRRHVLLVQGNKNSKQRAEEIIYEIARSLAHSSGMAEFPEAETTCSICLCEVEDNFQLEACSHEFCRACLIEQFESVMKNRDGFPVCCAHEGCRTPILLTDLKSLIPVGKLEDLFRASLGAFVASSGGAYRFCPSPDCPAVYRVASPGMSELFLCEACYVETCTGCHLEYHPDFSCKEYKKFKDDPDWSIKLWKKGQKIEVVKNCPVCNSTIEKIDGCNHILCPCGKHICWECSETFDSSDDCYNHLRSVHHSIT